MIVLHILPRIALSIGLFVCDENNRPLTISFRRCNTGCHKENTKAVRHTIVVEVTMVEVTRVTMVEVTVAKGLRSLPLRPPTGLLAQEEPKTSTIVYLHRSLAGWPVLQCVGGGGWPRASEASTASTPES